MSQIQSLVVPLVFIVGLTLANSIVFRKKFEYVLPFALMESILITYVFGFISLKIGVVVSVLAAVSSIPLLIYSIRKTDYSLKTMYLTNLFWVFIILYFAVFTLNIGKSFLRWDEFTHWGMMAKEMCRLDKYYYLDESVLRFHKQYPPFTAIAEYIWCQLCGGYKERHLYNAKIILSLSMLFPVYAWVIDRYVVLKKRMEKYVYILLSAVFIMLIPLVADVGEAALYRTIYTEYIIISLFFCGAFTLLFHEEDKVWFVLSNTMLLTSLVLVKQISLIFYAGLILLYCCKLINKKYRKSIINLLYFIIIPLSCWEVWNYIAKKVSASGGQFALSKFSPSNIIDVFTGQGEAYQYVTMSKYWTSLYSSPLVEKPIGIPYIGVFFLLLGLLILQLCMEPERKNKRNLIIIGGCSLFSMLPYAGVMLVSYLFGFNETESTSLVCYPRYMNVLLCPLLMISIIVIIGILCRRYNRRMNGILLAGICILLIGVIPNATLKEELTPGVYCYDVQDIFKGDAAIINDNTRKDASILLVNVEDNDSVRNILAYMCNPRWVERSRVNEAISVDELQEKMRNCDYLYLSKVDEAFVREYGVIFDDNEEIENQKLYKISITEGSQTVKLEKMN